MWTDFAKTSLYSIQSGADHTHQKYDCKFAFCLPAIAFVFFFICFDKETTTPSLICIIFHIIRKLNPKTILMFHSSISKFTTCFPIEAQLEPQKFVSRILCCTALVYNSFFFSEQPFYGNYLTLDSHTNKVIFHAVSYSSRWLPKP